MRKKKLNGGAIMIQKYMRGWRSHKKTLFLYMTLKTTQCADYFLRMKQRNEMHAG